MIGVRRTSEETGRGKICKVQKSEIKLLSHKRPGPSCSTHFDSTCPVESDLSPISQPNNCLAN